VLELPPPTQGIAALEGLGLLERSSPSLSSQIRCMQLALEDALARVRDGADVSDLLEPAFLDRRREETPAAAAEPPGGTVYLCAVDSDRMAVSFIQSNYMGFGSGLVAPGTGVALQNRGACFSVSGAVEPGRRPSDHPGVRPRRRSSARSASWAASFRQATFARLSDRRRRPRPQAAPATVLVDSDVVGPEDCGSATPTSALGIDRARDEHGLLRRRAGDPRLRRRSRRRVRPAQGRLCGRLLT
jgi:hypothetical protein